MTISTDHYYLFESLVNNDGEKKNEVECGKHLHHATQFLLPGTPIQVNVDYEDRNYFGSTDFILAATLRDDRNQEANCAFIWELKAPQCYLFERDNNNNRYRPTLDYIKAENQLLHYYYQAVGDSHFRQRYAVLETRNIRLGGIIIGRSKDRLAKNIVSVADKTNVMTALSIRQDYLYQSHGIRVLTWDRVLEFLKPLQGGDRSSKDAGQL